jgi:hypothetical protein
MSMMSGGVRSEVSIAKFWVRPCDVEFRESNLVGCWNLSLNVNAYDFLKLEHEEQTKTLGICKPDENETSMEDIVSNDMINSEYTLQSILLLPMLESLPSFHTCFIGF